jgi:hypothetical protein
MKRPEIPREEQININARQLYMDERVIGQGAWVNLPERERAEYRRRAEEEMPDRTGYYDKYFVRKKGDAQAVHLDCEFFVLDMTHDVYALTAVMYYRDAVREANPRLAEDLDERIARYCTCIAPDQPAYECPIHGGIEDD